METPLQHVPRPGSSSGSSENKSAFVVQRNTLTLYISFAAIILSCASAGVNLFTFYGGGQQKMVNEADQILLKAQANRVLREVNLNPQSHPTLQAELRKLYRNLQYHPSADAALSLYERAAFSVAVDAYAVPLSTVQSQRLQAIQSANGVMPVWVIRSRKYEGCFVDPYEEGCPSELSLEPKEEPTQK